MTGQADANTNLLGLYVYEALDEETHPYFTHQETGYFMRVYSGNWYVSASMTATSFNWYGKYTTSNPADASEWWSCCDRITITTMGILANVL